MKYIIDRLTKPEHFTKDITNFMIEEVPKINKIFGNSFNHEMFKPYLFANNGFFLICKRNDEIRGVMLAVIRNSIFDNKTKMLRQVLFYVKPNSGRTACYLFKKFIDIGKAEANHIITVLTSQTNIKPETLQKMGFKELEVVYRLEV